MADKYIIHGAAFNGDGTASNEAASAGAAGAWNDINVLEGTAPGFGSLAAGDVVYIRSKTSAGADITRTKGAAVTLGSTNATASMPITWVLDNGSVWSGVSGVLKYTWATNSTYTTTYRQYNVFVSATPYQWVDECTAATPSTSNLFSSQEGSVVRGILFDISSKTSSTGASFQCSGGLVERCRFKLGRLGSSFFTNNGHTQQKFFGCEFELVSALNGGSMFAGIAGSPAGYLLSGGRVHGIGATNGSTTLCNAGNATTVGQIEFIGVQYPNTMPFSSRPYRASRLSAFGADGGTGGALSERWGHADSRNDGLYPTLNAVLPDSAGTPWSWRVYPEYANADNQIRMSFSKNYTQAAAAKTVTLELLVGSTFSGVNRTSLYMNVSYVNDATGETVTESTWVLGEASLASSSAVWSATTYGAVNLLKRKLALTTGASIKQDTPEIVTLCGTATATTPSQLLFVCPDVQLT